jgi:hypothetical protein
MINIIMWIRDGVLHSAYNCQFLGAMTSFPAPVIWTTSDVKAKFFSWLVLQQSADSIDETHTVPSLCMDETTDHILTKCNYIEAA